jgi:anti-sigma B factor antagonist
MQLQTKIPPNNPDVTIIYLSGRLDVHYSIEIEEEINRMIEQGRLKLVINLQGVEYLSSSGLRIFIATARQLKSKNGGLKLVRMSESVRKVFMVVELLDMFEIFDSDEEAIATFKA